MIQWAGDRRKAVSGKGAEWGQEAVLQSIAGAHPPVSSSAVVLQKGFTLVLTFSVEHCRMS